ncbi:hypothetical protein [Escherichia coli]|nr:hypothetical protein [Escherichia coli]
MNKLPAHLSRQNCKIASTNLGDAANLLI